MDHQRLLTALRRDIDAEVLHGPASLGVYARDASNYRVGPVAVARPRSVSGLVDAVAAARGSGVPVTMRGAGTSIAGNSIGPGLVIDTSRYLNAITDLDPSAETVHVEPGVVLTALQKAAAPHGLRFAPDPSTANRATLGGMIGNNACGSHSVRWGSTASNVEALDIVHDGRIVTVGAGLAPESLDQALRDFTDQRLALLRTELSPWPRRVSGYGLEHLLPEHGFQVARALVGTEGGIAPVVGARLKLVRIPARLGLLVLGFPDDIAAADAVPALLPHRPYTVEGFADDLLGDTPPQGLLPAGRAWLFVEVGGDTDAALADHAAALMRATGVTEGDPYCALILDPAQRAKIWALRADGAGRATRAPSGAPAWPGLEDAVVQPEHLGSYLRRFRALMNEYGLTGSPYGHFGEGCIHIRLDFDFAAADGVSRFEGFMNQAADLIVAHHGSISGEHGDGRARGELLAKMYSPEMVQAFADFKQIWDPGVRLNPSVIVNPPSITADLAPARPVKLRIPAPLTLHADRGDLAAGAHRCVGVGKCVSTQTNGLMCPSYQATRAEEHSTRGRARLLQDYVTGASDERPVLEALDLCLACKGCKSECPTGVDMAAYKSSVLEHHYKGKIRPRTHYALGWLPTWLRLGHKAGPLAARLSASPVLGQLAMRMAGLARGRSLPAIPPRSFRATDDHRAPAATAVAGEVVLWPDTFTDHLEPAIAHAAIEVLEAAGHTVTVPGGNVCCGLTWISTGQLDHARKILRRTVDAIPDSDAPIVVLEPSCAASLREELPQLLADDPRAVRLAERVVSLAQILQGPAGPGTALPGSALPGSALPGSADAAGPGGSRSGGAAGPGGGKPAKLDLAATFDLGGTEVNLQPHCHQRSGWGFADDVAVLTGAGATIAKTIDGCCGLAGNFGMERGHEEVSEQVAALHLLPALENATPGSALVADGYSCRTQVHDLAPAHRPLHLAQLLAQGLKKGPAAE
jgi:FAD/FMN-containing dehydrogenase/Fe-S oxidoreductase